MKPLNLIFILLVSLLSKPMLGAEQIDTSVVTMKQELNLNDKQTNKINQIVIEHRKKLEDLKKQISMANKKKQSEIDAVLDAKQKKKLEQSQTPSFPKGSEPPAHMMPMGVEPEPEQQPSPK